MFGLGYLKVLFQLRWFYVSEGPTLWYSPFYFHGLFQRSPCYLFCFCLFLVLLWKNVLSVFLLNFSQVSYHFLFSYWKPRESLSFLVSIFTYTWNCHNRRCLSHSTRLKKAHIWFEQYKSCKSVVWSVRMERSWKFYTTSYLHLPI